MKLSSATTGMGMADLEELGYIVQPFILQPGRIPTDKGYRFYVDDMMSERKRYHRQGKLRWHQGKVRWLLRRQSFQP